jgi:hypothetical protein
MAANINPLQGSVVAPRFPWPWSNDSSAFCELSPHGVSAVRLDDALGYVCLVWACALCLVVVVFWVFTCIRCCGEDDCTSRGCGSCCRSGDDAGEKRCFDNSVSHCANCLGCCGAVELGSHLCRSHSGRNPNIRSLMVFESLFVVPLLMLVLLGWALVYTPVLWNGQWLGVYSLWHWQSLRLLVVDVRGLFFVVLHFWLYLELRWVRYRQINRAHLREPVRMSLLHIMDGASASAAAAAAVSIAGVVGSPAGAGFGGVGDDANRSPGPGGLDTDSSAGGGFGFGNRADGGGGGGGSDGGGGAAAAVAAGRMTLAQKKKARRNRSEWRREVKARARAGPLGECLVDLAAGDSNGGAESDSGTSEGSGGRRTWGGHGWGRRGGGGGGGRGGGGSKESGRSRFGGVGGTRAGAGTAVDDAAGDRALHGAAMTAEERALEDDLKRHRVALRRRSVRENSADLDDLMAWAATTGCVALVVLGLDIAMLLWVVFGFDDQCDSLVVSLGSGEGAEAGGLLLALVGNSCAGAEVLRVAVTLLSGAGLMAMGLRGITHTTTPTSLRRLCFTLLLLGAAELCRAVLDGVVLVMGQMWSYPFEAVFQTVLVALPLLQLLLHTLVKCDAPVSTLMGAASAAAAEASAVIAKNEASGLSVAVVAAVDVHRPAAAGAADRTQGEGAAGGDGAAGGRGRGAGVIDGGASGGDHGAAPTYTVGAARLRRYRCSQCYRCLGGAGVVVLVVSMWAIALALNAVESACGMVLQGGASGGAGTIFNERYVVTCRAALWPWPLSAGVALRVPVLCLSANLSHVVCVSVCLRS